MSKWILLIAMAFVAMGAPAAETGGFELKGLRMGMSEADFIKLHPKAKCGKTGSDPKWGPGLPQRRTCYIEKFSVAHIDTQSARALFIEGQLASLDFTVYDFHESDLRRALADKFGVPRPWRSNDIHGVSWNVGTVNMLLVKSFGGGNVYLSADSRLSRDWDEKLAAQKLKQGKADL